MLRNTIREGVTEVICRDIPVVWPGVTDFYHIHEAAL